MYPSPTRLLGALLCASLAACSAVPPDRGRGTVDALLERHGIATGATSTPHEPTPGASALGTAPLDLTAAIHMALSHNPELRGRYAELGFAAAEVYEAGRLSNPTLSLGYLFVGRGDLDNEKSVGLSQSFTGLILLPARRRLADAEFARVQHAVAAAAQQLAHDVALAWYDLAGARESAQLQAEIARTARLAADLAERYFDAGNLERGELAESRAAAAAARLDALRAEMETADSAARFSRLLGVRSPPDGWRLPRGLPEPALAEVDPKALLQQADQGRLDLAAARQAVARQADALGVTHRFRYLGEIELGPVWEWNEDGMRSVGPHLGMELPLFDRGAGKVARAEAALALAGTELDALEIDIVTEVERASAAARNALARYAEYSTVLLPARREVVARTQERVNFMLTGPFDLLQAKQDEFQAGLGLIEAAADFWHARVELARAAGLPPPAPTAPARLSARQLTRSVTSAEASHAQHGTDHNRHGAQPPPGEHADHTDHTDHSTHHGDHP